MESSKTDQFRDGAWVPIARTHSNICPVSMLEQYIKPGEIGGDPDRLLFRGLSSTKQGYHLRASGGISYTPNYLACIVSGLGVRQQQLMLLQVY